MNHVKSMLLASAFGFRDSLLGTISLFSIDNDSEDGPKMAFDGNKDAQFDGRPPSRRSQRQRPKKEQSKVLPMMMQCCLLNGGVFLLSMLMFENYLIPIVKFLAEKIFVVLTNNNSKENKVWILIEPIMSYTFRSLWVVPLFWLSKILNSLWFLEIADAAYRRKHGRPLTSLLASRTDSVFKYLSKLMSDFLFSIIVEVLFMFQATLVSLVPVIGPSLAFVHLALLYSLYAFEYTWMNLGWGVVKRISYIENHWPYFVGFGFSLAMLSTTTSAVVSGCIFGVLFPLFILSGLEAKPAEKCATPIRLFSLVIWLTNKTFLKSKTMKPANVKPASSSSEAKYSTQLS